MRIIDADALLKQLRRNPLFEKAERDKGMFYIERSCIDAMPTLTLDDIIPHGRWTKDQLRDLIGRLRYYATTYAIGDNLGREIQGTDELLFEAADVIYELLIGGTE